MSKQQVDNSGENKPSIFTKETLGVVLVLFATLCLVCLITREKVFYVPGQYVNAFLLGTFGYFAYAVNIYVFLLGVKLITDKNIPLGRKYKLLGTLAFFLIALLAHIISMGASVNNFGEYIKTAYQMGEGGISTASAGGVIMSLISYPVSALLTVTGSSVVVGLGVVAVVGVLAVDLFNAKKQGYKKPAQKFRSSVVDKKIEDGVEISGEMEYPVSGVSFQTQKPNQKLFVNNEEDFAFKTKKEISKGETELKIDFSDKGLGVSRSQGVYSESYANEMKKKIEYIKTPTKFDYDAHVKNSYYGTTVSEAIPPQRNSTIASEIQTGLDRANQTRIPMIEHEQKQTEAEIRAEDFSSKYLNTEPNEVTEVKTEEPTVYPFVNEPSSIVEEPIFEEKNEEPITRSFEVQQPETAQEEKSEDLPLTNLPLTGRRRSMLFSTPEENQESVDNGGFNGKLSSDGDLFARRRSASVPQQEPQQKTEQEKEKPQIPINRVYHKPPLDLLEKHEMPNDAPTENHEERKAIIKQTLEEFHINAEPKDYIQGPTITRYEIIMPPGISVKKVLNYDNDLKMRLSSKDGVRIEAPIPGKNAVGIEVANKTKITVGLRELLEQTANAKLGEGKLVFAIGKDIVGNAITDNLAKGPHYLVAGATGSGKSVCLNVMIVSLLMRYSPEDLRLILIDPKSVGFRIYEHIPHLMIDEIITEPKRALAALSWAQVEMERRYKVFAECPELIMDIEAYNSRIAGPTVAKMPRIVVVIDELADLMETCKKDMEAKIRAIAQKARAAGIHLVLATQRPSVDIITGTIKANLPSRIALKVMNFNDSQTILSEAGAEKLLGNGDMLYKNSSMPECERYQGAWISDREITNVVNYIKERNESYFDDDLKDYLDKSTNQSREESTFEGESEDGESEVSDLFKKALWLAINTGTVSISQLQRRFQIGYPRAGGLVDKMQQLGYVSENDGGRARKVLITREEFEQKFGPMSDTF